MTNIYLEKLGLQAGATKSEIKKAYYKLSKKYHPDLNKDPDAKYQFIEITEAYKFLTDVGPKPHNEPVNYDYDPQTSEYEQWRKRAREYAIKREKEAEKEKLAAMLQFIYWFNYVSVVILAFNVLLSIDYLIPHQEVDQKIRAVHMGYEGRSKYYSYDDVYFDDYTMRFDSNSILNENYKPNAKVVVTPILKTPVKAIIKIDGVPMEFTRSYGLYSLFVYFIPAIFLAEFIYRFLVRSLDSRIGIAVTMFFIFCLQIYLFFTR